MFKIPRLLSLFLTFALCSLFFVTAYAMADTGAVSPNDFLSQVLAYVQSFGGLAWMAKVSGVILLVIASMKVSFLSGLWAKLGAFQTWIAPILGLFAGLFSLPAFSWAGVTGYVLAGGGAVFLHELLDSVKGLPGIGSVYVSLIDLVEGALGGPGVSGPDAAKLKS